MASMVVQSLDCMAKSVALLTPGFFQVMFLDDVQNPYFLGTLLVYQIAVLHYRGPPSVLTLVVLAIKYAHATAHQK